MANIEYYKKKQREAEIKKEIEEYKKHRKKDYYFDIYVVLTLITFFSSLIYAL